MYENWVTIGFGGERGKEVKEMKPLVEEKGMKLGGGGGGGGREWKGLERKVKWSLTWPILMNRNSKMLDVIWKTGKKRMFSG